jgi:hypothetical protein
MRRIDLAYIFIHLQAQKKQIILAWSRGRSRMPWQIGANRRCGHVWDLGERQSEIGAHFMNWISIWHEPPSGWPTEIGSHEARGSWEQVRENTPSLYNLCASQSVEATVHDAASSCAPWADKSRSRKFGSLSRTWIDSSQPLRASYRVPNRDSYDQSGITRAAKCISIYGEVSEQWSREAPRFPRALWPVVCFSFFARHFPSSLKRHAFSQAYNRIWLFEYSSNYRE